MLAYARTCLKSSGLSLTSYVSLHIRYRNRFSADWTRADSLTNPS